MKAVIPCTEQDMISGNLFDTGAFAVYEYNGTGDIERNVIQIDEKGYNFFGEILRYHEVSILVCNGIDAPTARDLTRYGILIYAHVTGNMDDAFLALLTGKLKCTAKPEFSGNRCEPGKCTCGNCT